MKLPQATLTVLSSGLPLVHVHHRAVASGIFGMTVFAGSADDPAGAHGLAHLVEHTIFKGTRKRRSWHIINRMEAIGGELNAFTTKEETTVYSIFPGGAVARAAELVADLAIDSQFPDRELDKEREVVIDEINSYLDSPMDAVYDDFDDLVYAGSGLGHNILGTPESVRGLHGADCRAFLRRYYNTRNAVLFYSGPTSPERVRDVCERYFGALPSGERTAHGSTPFRKVREERSVAGLHQTHAVLGIEADGVTGPGRFADALFANLMGGPGMNSLLNVELREHRGLVYTVEASVTLFAATGMLTVYYGCDSDDSLRCRDLCEATSRRVADSGEDALRRRLSRAKRQYLGQMAVASENRENRIIGIARHALHTGVLPEPEASAGAIEAVGTDDIRRRAAALADASYLIFNP